MAVHHSMMMAVNISKTFNVCLKLMQLIIQEDFITQFLFCSLGN
jgi:hypothetical protein